MTATGPATLARLLGGTGLPSRAHRHSVSSAATWIEQPSRGDRSVWREPQPIPFASGFALTY